MLVIVNAPLPTLRKVTVCGLLGVPTACDAKVRLDGLRSTSGTLNPPISATKASPKPPKAD